METLITELLEKHLDAETGALDKESFIKDYGVEAPKQLVPKTVFNEKNEELKNAKDTLEELEGANNTDELKEQLEEYQRKLEEVETQRLEERKETLLKGALTESVDADFVVSLLKDKVELNEEGSELSGLDGLLAEFKNERPYLFKKEEPGGPEQPEQPEVNNKRLPSTEGKPLTRQDINEMKTQEERFEARKNNPHLYPELQ